MDGKVPLQFALAAVIEAFRINPDKYNILILYNMPSSSSSSLTPIPTQQSLLFHIEGYKDIIIEIADKLYNMLIKELISRISISIIDIKTSYANHHHHHHYLTEREEHNFTNQWKSIRLYLRSFITTKEVLHYIFIHTINNIHSKIIKKG
jgi:hypothetical protein